MLYHQGALGRAAHLFLLQPQILRQLGQLLLQHLGQHGPALALLMQQAQPRALLGGRGIFRSGLLRHPGCNGERPMEGGRQDRPATSAPGFGSWLWL